MKTILRICGLLMICSTLFGQIITEDLIGYWPFEGNAEDHSGNNHHGTVYGAVLGMDRFNNTNNSYIFNGVNDCIAIYYDTSLGVNESLTVSFWFNSDNPSSSGFSMPIAIAQTFGLRLFYALFNQTSNTYDIMFRLFSDPDNSDSFYSNINFLTVHRNCHCFDEKWHHFVGVYNNETETSYLYLDNQLLATNNIGPFDFQQNNVPITIGCYMKLDGSGFRGFYKGQIDDVMLFTKALSEDEINDLHYYNPTHTDSKSKQSLSVYPNPGNGQYRIISNAENAKNNYTINIIDCTGRFIKSFIIDSVIMDISLIDSPNGLYLLQLYNDSGELIQTNQIVKH